MNVLRNIGIGVGVIALLAAGGWQLSQESESVQHFAEKNAAAPSNSEVEATLNAFETAFREKRDIAACKYLTPRSLREFLVGTGGRDPGHLSMEAFKRGCPLFLRIRSKGVKVPRIHIEVQKIDKEEFKGHYYLNVYPQRGPSIVMNDVGTKIVIFSGVEPGE